VRLFVGVDLSGAVRDAVENSIAAIPIKKPPWRWTQPGSWHVTLKFIGDVDQPLVDSIAKVLTSVATGFSPFQISVTTLDGFPRVESPRVIFYKVDQGAEELGQLADAVDRALHERLSIPTESKPFRAHVTVARVKQPVDRKIGELLSGVPKLREVGQEVSSFVLMRSHLDRQGARYERVKQFALTHPA